VASKIARFAETSHSGDRAEAEGIPEDATAWVLRDFQP